jgi:hypothetical protein
MVDFTVLILSNSSSDLTKLKFKEFNIVNVQSEEFLSFCDETSTRRDEFMKMINDDYKIFQDNKYVIINKNREKFGAKKVYDVYNFILTLFPSSLTVEYILDYNFAGDCLRFQSSYHFNDNLHSVRDSYLLFNEDDVTEINSFIDEHFGNHLNISYLKSSIQNYLNAFDSNYSHFSFIAFCICLESITDGTAELIYRIARNVAVICGSNEENSLIIFHNIKKIYALRSKIVHGSDFSDDTVNDYLYYLELICSKLIVELLKHNISNIKLLNEKITTLGFGEKEKISSNKIGVNFNHKIESEIYNSI